MIRNLKSKLKAMSSSSPLHNQKQNASTGITTDPCTGIDKINPETFEHSEHIEVKRSNEMDEVGNEPSNVGDIVDKTTGDIFDKIGDIFDKRCMNTNKEENKKMYSVTGNGIKARGVFDGQIIETGDGSFVRKRIIYELETTYGNINLSGL